MGYDIKMYVGTLPLETQAVARRKSDSKYTQVTSRDTPKEGEGHTSSMEGFEDNEHDRADLTPSSAVEVKWMQTILTLDIGKAYGKYVSLLSGTCTDPLVYVYADGYLNGIIFEDMYENLMSAHPIEDVIEAMKDDTKEYVVSSSWLNILGALRDRHNSMARPLYVAFYGS